MRFVAVAAGVAGLILCSALGVNSSVDSTENTRKLSFVHTHTHAALEIVYWRDGEYDQGSLDTANAFLRDFRSHSVAKIDPALFDVLFEIKQATGSRKPFQVISAYRSPETNEMLRSQGRGVAKNSYHMRGKAIDIRLADVPTDRLREIALHLGRGGVGYYEASDFVHVDTGPVRRW